MSSRQWRYSRSLQLRALSPPGLVQGRMLGLDAPAVEYSESPWGGGVLNYVSVVDTIPVLHWLSLESCSVPYSPTRDGYSPTKSTAVTPLQLSQSAVCKSLPLPPRWKSLQDPFHPPPVLLADQHPKHTSSRRTRLPIPGVPETSFRAGLELITCGVEHSHQLIDGSDEHAAAWLPRQDTRVQNHRWLSWEHYSILNWYFLDRGPPCHPLAPEPLLYLGRSSFRPQYSLSVAPM